MYLCLYVYDLCAQAPGAQMPALSAQRTGETSVCCHGCVLWSWVCVLWSRGCVLWSWGCVCVCVCVCVLLVAGVCVVVMEVRVCCGRGYVCVVVVGVCVVVVGVWHGWRVEQATYHINMFLASLPQRLHENKEPSRPKVMPKTGSVRKTSRVWRCVPSSPDHTLIVKSADPE
jgi:hypothetical protein